MQVCYNFAPIFKFKTGCVGLLRALAWRAELRRIFYPTQLVYTKENQGSLGPPDDKKK
jgi:hypothetical protein